MSTKLTGEIFLKTPPQEQAALVFGFMEGFMMCEDRGRELADLTTPFLDVITKNNYNADVVAKMTIQRINFEPELKNKPFTWAILKALKLETTLLP